MALIIQVVNTSPKLTILVVGCSDATCSFMGGVRYFYFRETAGFQKMATNH